MTGPAVWTDAHHQTDWTKGGQTDLNQMIPLCRAHHTLVTSHGWHVTHDPATGICTWTAPDGRIIHTHPPADEHDLLEHLGLTEPQQAA